MGKWSFLKTLTFWSIIQQLLAAIGVLKQKTPVDLNDLKPTDPQKPEDLS